uniref:Uncharacterized protein n=1 Tax=Cyprinus carpio carpio TaxID=630221 RepID=A0A8C1EZ67_CYPCA
FICFNSEEHFLVRIYVELLGVQHTQFSIGGFDVVHVLHGFVQAMQHDSTVSSNHGVSHDGSGIVQVSKVAEVPLLGDMFVGWINHVHPKDAYHRLLFSSAKTKPK